MTARPHTSAGFSAVELLITLFIVAAFLMVGYQLYAVITRDSVVVRQQASASNVAARYLEEHSASAPATCTAQTLLDESITEDGVPNAHVIVVRSCPSGAPAGLSRIAVTVRYGDDQEVHHARYVGQ